MTVRDQAWITQSLAEKRNNRGYRMSHTMSIPNRDAEKIVREAVRALGEAFNDGAPVVTCANPAAKEIAAAIATQMGRTNHKFV